MMEVHQTTEEASQTVAGVAHHIAARVAHQITTAVVALTGMSIASHYSTFLWDYLDSWADSISPRIINTPTISTACQVLSCAHRENDYLSASAHRGF